MDPRQAVRNLELIRTLMERTTQYQFLTARAGLAAGCIAGLGALTFLVLDVRNPWHFGSVWGSVFAKMSKVNSQEKDLRTANLCRYLESLQAR